MADVHFFFLALCIPTFFLIFLKLILRLRPIKISIKSRHVLITGGSSGIGLAIAHQAAAEGARVTILARDRKKLEEAKKSIRLSIGVDVAIISADVRDFEAVKKAVESAGPIDVLVCNQGVFVARELENQEMEEIRSTIDVNLMGTVNLVKAALPGMKNRSDRRPVSIAFMLSQAGQVGVYGYAVYSATKFGLRGFAEALQQEVINDDIHVSLVFPPKTYTPGLDNAKRTMPKLTRIIVAFTRAMQADDVAKGALKGIKNGCFLVSFNLDGLLLSIATTGLSPQRSYLMAFLEIIFASLARFLALLTQRKVYGIIHKWHAQMKY